VGHRGHTALEETSEEERGASLKWQKEGTSLQAQVRHKIEVVKAIRKAYPRSDRDDDEDVKIIIVGHSVGAWIGLRVLEEMGDDIDGLQLLFPTVMNIAHTPKARTLPLLVSGDDVKAQIRWTPRKNHSDHPVLSSGPL
jgi:alpha-beta hydrolase superfamily lysophospholipase